MDQSRVIQEINGGVLAEQLSHAIASAAKGAIVHRGKGRVRLELVFTPITNDGSQVNVASILSMHTPTARGHTAEVGKTDTPMFVSHQGALSALPHTPDLFAPKKQGETA